MSDGEKDYTSYAKKDPTDLHSHLAEWIKDKTEYDPATAKSKAEAFQKGVQLGALLRMDHQSSPENQERRRTLAERTKPVEEAKPAKATKATKPVAKATATETKPTAKRQRGPKAAPAETATAAF